MTVVTLAPRDEAYQAEVIERLEALLEAAKRGEMLSIVYACERPGNALTFGATHVRNRYELLGFLSYQMYQAHVSIDGDSEPSDLLDGV